MVDEDLLCRHAKLLYEKLQENVGDEMKLRSTFKATFQLFQHWLYAQATTKEEQALEPTNTSLDDDPPLDSSHSESRDTTISTPAWVKVIGKSRYETLISLAKQHRRREILLAVNQNLS
jgi:hypothetical protein